MGHALETYYAEHDAVRTDADARGPAYLWIGPEETGEPAGAAEGTSARIRQVRQTLADPADHRDWVVEAVVDLDATDAAGELVLAATRAPVADGRGRSIARTGQSRPPDRVTSVDLRTGRSPSP